MKRSIRAMTFDEAQPILLPPYLVRELARKPGFTCYHISVTDGVCDICERRVSRKKKRGGLR